MSINFDIEICDETAEVSAIAEEGVPVSTGRLLCQRPKGHDGQHWDPMDNITWAVGVPS